MPHLQVALVPAPDQVVVRLTGDADLSTVARLNLALEQAAGLSSGPVVVDVAGARFWDCSGLHALTLFTATLAPAGRRCRVVGAPAATRRLVRTAGLADRLELDGPLGGEDPVHPVPPARPPAAEAVVAAGAGARRSPVATHPVRPTEERPVRRCLRLPDLRRWR
ncbi:STAS domain-containing protein [Geodermatophilus ruber]|uniref:Anti-anti-sigma factor n=1 Tax=Geodermatophilus ruber TaxID=504800 RepID=A0A1I4DZC3_9ACTN|nr:STAS domain-containing protein [Geodermatophilus ruber]SFK97456.1 anti-anti-sigma factor [Geodermatophilus ruber]